MDGGASNSCPAEWKSRNINFDFYKIKRDLFTGRPMRWLTSQRVSIGRSWVKSDSLQNPLHSTGGSSWLRCRTSFPPPAFSFFILLFFPIYIDSRIRLKVKGNSPTTPTSSREKRPPYYAGELIRLSPTSFFFHQTARLSLWWQPFSQQTVLFRLQRVYIRSQKLSLQRPGDEYIIII